MHTEYEERVLEINKDELISKLEELGAKKVGEWFQKRYVYDFNPIRENEWIRLRTNGESTTLTYKNVEKNTIDGTKELEVVVSNFEETNELLNVLGYKAKGYQENKRIRYLLNNVEIDIDSWPKIPTYVEFEAQNEQDIKKIELALGIDNSKITNLNCEDIYKEIYGINVKAIKDLRFEKN